ASGYNALNSNTTGDNNTAYGYQAGYNNISGSSNIFLGYLAGYDETGSNKLYIQNSNADEDNALIYGEFNNNVLRVNGLLQFGQAGTTNYLPIANLGLNNIGLEGDVVPYSNTSFDLGNNNATEHWDDVVANTFVTFSDRNTKNNIKQLNYGLTEVMKLQPVSYRYKEFISPNPRTRLGLIAQEVEKVIPEVVITEDVDVDPKTGEKIITKGDYKAMSYTELIPVLIKAIQEQQNQIEDLKTQIKQLKKNK
ncbi:MAG: tail fiber domain-containing protein, partial [Flavobacteriales bacterium]